jgi:drug/metabolite transporter (DMT)-like permease
MLPSKKILIYEVVGTLFIIFLGSAFHFTYELSGKLAIVGAFSAVNESVWEHLKLAFWPSVIWLLIEYLLIRKLTSNFFISKTLGACTMIALIPIVFYSYTSITGGSIFAIDIATFIVAVIVGQIASYILLNKNQLSRNTDKVALIILVILGIAFIIFTFYPPHLPIFQDPISRGYGLAM